MSPTRLRAYGISVSDAEGLLWTIDDLSPAANTALDGAVRKAKERYPKIIVESAVEAWPVCPHPLKASPFRLAPVPSRARGRGHPPRDAGRGPGRCPARRLHEHRGDDGPGRRSDQAARRNRLPGRLPCDVRPNEDPGRADRAGGCGLASCSKAFASDCSGVVTESESTRRLQSIRTSIPKIRPIRRARGTHGVGLNASLAPVDRAEAMAPVVLW
jgi:hypothetical protein